MARSTNVVVMQKELGGGREQLMACPFSIRPLEMESDLLRWIALWERVSPELGLSRVWTQQEVALEFAYPSGNLRRPAWLAVPQDDVSETAAGAISLTKPSERRDRPYVHWLLVHPDCRREGVGTYLLSTAEAHCRQLGHDTLRLETHRRWKAAVAFYLHHGFEIIRE